VRVLIISINYAPEATGFAPHTTALAEHLSKRDHEVLVLAGFPFAPHWKRFGAYARRFIAREKVNGVKLIRLTHFIPRRPGSAVQRVLMEATFATMGFLVMVWRMAAGWRPDVVVYVGAQPGLAWLSRLLAALARVPYLVEINDLASQASVDVGIVRLGVVHKFLDRIEFAAYRNAAKAIVLCDSFRDALVEHGYGERNVHVISLSVDLAVVRPGGDGRAFRSAAGIPADAFLVLCSGSFGLKQGIADAIRAVELLRDEYPDVHLALVGEGEAMESLRQLVAASAFHDRVHLMPLQAEDQIRSMLAAADVFLVSQLRSVKQSVIPSKLLFYMAAGRPILAAVNERSQGAALVRAARGGLIVTPEDPSAMAAGIQALRADEGERREFGRRNREYAELHFDRDTIVRAKEHVIDLALRNHTGLVAGMRQ